MTTNETLSAVVEALQPWANENGGEAAAAGDIYSLVDLLALRPGGLRVGVVIKGEKPRNDYGLVDRSFLIVLSRGKGFAKNPSDSLTTGQGNGRPLYDLTEEARDIVRALEFPPGTNTALVDGEPVVIEDNEIQSTYMGWTPFAVGDAVFVDAYQLEFEIGCRI